MTDNSKTTAITATNQHLQPSFFQVPDVATVTTQMIFQSGLTRSNITELAKKILMAFAAKYIYDNINKIGGYIFSARTRLAVLLFILKLLRCNKLLLRKEANELVEELSSIKLDQTRLQSALDGFDLKKDCKHGFYKLCDYWCLVDNYDNQLIIYSLSPNFNQRFLVDYKLPVVTSTIATQYKVLIVNYSGSKVTVAGSNNGANISGSNDVNFSWSNPTRTTGMVNDTHSDFFKMVACFVSKSHKLKDSATQAYVINGPVGVGKTTVVERIASMNIVNTILKVNMMNFVNHSEDLEAILNKIICPFPVKSDSETWLIVFDEIDKWKNLWLANKAREFVMANGSSNGSLNNNTKVVAEQLLDYLISLNNNFYNTLQRFIDGEILTKVPRLLVMFLTNHGDTLWQLTVSGKVYSLPADYRSVKDRFVSLELDFCGYKEVVSYLKLMYATLEEDYNMELLQQIPADIKISHRTLWQIRNVNMFKLDAIVAALQQHHYSSAVSSSHVTAPKLAGDSDTEINNRTDDSMNLDIDQLLVANCSNNNNIDCTRSIVTMNADCTSTDNKGRKQIPAAEAATSITTAKQQSTTSTSSTSNTAVHSTVKPITSQQQHTGINLVMTDDDKLAQLKTFDLVPDTSLVNRPSTEREKNRIPKYELPSVLYLSWFYTKVNVGVDYNDKIVRLYFHAQDGGLIGKVDVKDEDADGNLVLHGESITLLNGRPIEHGYYHHNKRCGEQSSWDKEGRLKSRYYLNENGKIDGVEEEYDYDKNTKSLTEYLNGSRHGKQLIYKGDIKIYEADFEHDCHSGPVVEYSALTSKRQQQYYLDNDDGEYDGLYTSYHDNGETKKLESNYVKGAKHGPEQEWDEKGQLVVTRTFQSGKEVL